MRPQDGVAAAAFVDKCISALFYALSEDQGVKGKRLQNVSGFIMLENAS